MKRDDAREIAIQLLFSRRFAEADLSDFLSPENLSSLSGECELYDNKLDDKSRAYIETILSLFSDHQEEIDALISKHSRGWNVSRISGTALAVLRCALTELLYCSDIPQSASINSAVELAKHYDDEKTVAFINGLLGSVARELASADE